jgi:hypothetical protein
MPSCREVLRCSADSRIKHWVSSWHVPTAPSDWTPTTETPICYVRLADPNRLPAVIQAPRVLVFCDGVGGGGQNEAESGRRDAPTHATPSTHEAIVPARQLADEACAQPPAEPQREKRGVCGVEIPAQGPDSWLLVSRASWSLIFYPFSRVPDIARRYARHSRPLTRASGTSIRYTIQL